VLEVENPICEHKSAVIHSSGVGLSIAKTLCDHYGWTLHDEQDKRSYRVIFSLDGNKN
jgi:hypothetical protein